MLEAKLASKPERRKHHTPNVAAYEAYLKGRHYQWKITPEASPSLGSMRLEDTI